MTLKRHWPRSVWLGIAAIAIVAAAPFVSRLGPARWPESLHATALAAPAPGDADKPLARIDGPSGVKPGELAILDASRSAAEDFAWVMILPATEAAGRKHVAVDDGRRCVFASGNEGRYTFVLAAASGGRVATAVHVVDVAASPGPGPNPSPYPGPSPPAPTPPMPGPGPSPPLPTPPAPLPDVPDGKFGLARLARDWVIAHVVQDPAGRSLAARSLASSFRSTASAIAAGTLSDPTQILAETRAANNRALAASTAAWRPWGEKLAATLDELHRAGKLRTADDYAAAWREIAIGLDAAAREAGR